MEENMIDPVQAAQQYVTKCRKAVDESQWDLANIQDSPQPAVIEELFQVRVDRLMDAVRAAALLEGADLIHQKAEWWDTRDRDTAAGLLRTASARPPKET